MGNCNLCKYNPEEKEKETKKTLITEIEESPELKTKKGIIKEIDLHKRIDTVSSEVTEKNTLTKSFFYILPESLARRDNIKTIIQYLKHY